MHLETARLQHDGWLLAPETQAVFRMLQADGATARCVGGAVRNALIGEPVGDIDIATTATPDESMVLAARVGLTVIPTGLQHGTITVMSGGIAYEVTTLRRDVETDGRHASIAFTDDWEADASRRDFTMNAIYCDADGRVFDPLGGYQDLAARRVRFIGDARQRIAEDYLRILRFFRFNAQYAAIDVAAAYAVHGDGLSGTQFGGESKSVDGMSTEGIGTEGVSAEGLSACIAMRQGLARLSAERVGAEMLKILAGPAAMPVCRIMYDSGFLPPILGVAPQLSNFLRLARIEAAAGRAGDPLLRLGALTIAVAEDVTRLTARLRLSKSEASVLAQGVFSSGAGNAWNAQLDERTAKRLLYQLGDTAYAQRALLAWARSRDDAGRLEWSVLLSLPARWRVPKLPLGGGDVVRQGIPPGPAVGDLLRKLEDWWIEADFPTDETALQQQLTTLIAASKAT